MPRIALTISLKLELFTFPHADDRFVIDDASHAKEGRQHVSHVYWYHTSRDAHGYFR